MKHFLRAAQCTLDISQTLSPVLMMFHLEGVIRSHLSDSEMGPN